MKGFFESRNMTMSADAIRMWVMALADLPIEQIEFAVMDFVRRGTDFPTPAAIRKHALDADGLSDSDRSIVAWDCVRKAISSAGSYRTVDFEDKVINATIRQMGGWVSLCNTPPAELKWVGKDFCKRYEIVCRAAIGDPSPLPGIIASNGDEVETLRISSVLPPHKASLALSRTDKGSVANIVQYTSALMKVPGGAGA
jgi:hypothetical protein